MSTQKQTNETPSAAADKSAQTPYQTLKATGEKSWFHSPDGFVKIEEFENGARYLHSPLIEYPVRMSNWVKLAKPADWVRCPDHRRGGATSCPRGGAALQIWQRQQWGDR
jgi:hypothetical protein